MTKKEELPSQYQKEYERFIKKLQARVRALRLEHELSQEDLQQFELSLRTIQRIEDINNTANITVLTLFKLAKAFKIKPGELLDL